LDKLTGAVVIAGVVVTGVVDRGAVWMGPVGLVGRERCTLLGTVTEVVGNALIPVGWAEALCTGGKITFTGTGFALTGDPGP
jgi:hypothetical protein